VVPSALGDRHRGHGGPLHVAEWEEGQGKRTHGLVHFPCGNTLHRARREAGLVTGGVQMSVIDADVKGRTRVEPSGPSSEEGLATTETGHSRRTVTLILAGLLAGLLLGFMDVTIVSTAGPTIIRSEEHTSELQSHSD